MSYILDALKKSDQQRQRGATPTLPSVPITAAAPKHPSSVYYGLLAAILLCAGILIGWLRPWQEEQPVLASAPPPDAKSSIPIQNQVVPISPPEPAEIARNVEQKLPAPNSISTVQEAPRINTIQPALSASASPRITSAVASAPSPMPKQPANPADTAIPLAELPLTIQQELPVMTIQLHSYSSKPLNSLVNINSKMLKEGDSLVSGLKLEQITPDGVIFRYKGYLFKQKLYFNQ
jgi:general secretion pathway protein B